MHSTTSTTASKEGIWLSPVILALDCSPAEKVLLARICQTAALTEGQCDTSNQELARQTWIPFHTLTKLVTKLIADDWMKATVNKAQANQRWLLPATHLLNDYSHFGNSLAVSSGQPSPTAPPYSQFGNSQVNSNQPPATNTSIPYSQNGNSMAVADGHSKNDLVPYSQFGNSTVGSARQSFSNAADPYSQNGNSAEPNKLKPVAPADEDRYRQVGKGAPIGRRHCVVTGLDISLQRNEVYYVTAPILEIVARFLPKTFLLVARRYLPGRLVTFRDIDRYCIELARTIREVGESGQPVEPLGLPPRVCPLTGLSIAHQQYTRATATEATIKQSLMEDQSRREALAARYLNGTDWQNLSPTRLINTLVEYFKHLPPAREPMSYQT